jgi:hypothetical protein
MTYSIACLQALKDQISDRYGRRGCGGRRIAHMQHTFGLVELEVVNKLAVSRNGLCPYARPVGPKVAFLQGWAIFPALFQIALLE